MAINTGITNSQLSEIASIIGNQVSTDRRERLTEILLGSTNETYAKPSTFLVRISEIEVDPAHIEAYNTILKEEAEASVRLEPGVMAIFPMYVKENSSRMRILEIYADEEAYQQHLNTPHFQKYKTTTKKMVKSLKLVDMKALDVGMMPQIFKKWRD